MRPRLSLLVTALAVSLSALSAHAETVVRYGMSMADVPLTTGQPDRGAGAYQFTGYTIYDPLVAWDMSTADKPGKLIPGLATEWKVDDKDKTKWRFTLRKGVKFHDGSDFTADAVSGSSGCNTYTGGYKLDGLDVTIGPLASTQKACEQPLMDQEAAFLKALQTPARVEPGGGTVRLRDAAGAIQVTFGPK